MVGLVERDTTPARDPLRRVVPHGKGAFTNMTSIKIVGLALFASLAISMVASASASATLGVFECVLGVGTSNLGSNCLTLAGGTYTVKDIVGAKSTGKAIGGTVLSVGTKNSNAQAVREKA
jgi:hypothetical protein